MIMDSQAYIEYEMVEPASNRRLITDSREEALAYYEKGWMVFETHKTVSRPSAFTQTRIAVVMQWNGNPEFQGE